MSAEDYPSQQPKTVAGPTLCPRRSLGRWPGAAGSSGVWSAAGFTLIEVLLIVAVGGPSYALADPNRVPNPNFNGTGGVNQGTTGTVPDQWRAFTTGGGVASTSIVPVATHELFTGCAATNAVKLKVTSFGTSHGFDHINSKFAITPGTSYHLEFYVKTANADNSYQSLSAGFPLYDSNGTYLNREPGMRTGIIATATWTKVVCPTFSDSQATLANVSFRLNNDGGEHAVLIAWPTVGDPPVRFPPPSPADIAQRPTWVTGQPLVGTTYFYWYRYSDLHFYDDYPVNNDDALTDHFVSPATVSMMSKDWHKGELSNMIDAGIDMLWPVYWGAPNNWDGPVDSLFIKGLVPLQQAFDDLAAQGKTPPRIGMFYDTTTLNQRDLTTPAGKDFFYQTIRSFWASVHPRYWACIDGRPVTLLYDSGFAQAYNQSSFDYVYTQFQNEFAGVRPYIIRERSWYNVQTEADYNWGAALNGPQLHGIAAIGPGYDESAVPGRPGRRRDRQNGQFYLDGWQVVMTSGRKIVHLETWNEMHEGTDICESVEYGRQYINLTRTNADRFRALRVSNLSPAPGTETFVRPASLVVTFNQPAAAASINASTFLLTRCGDDGIFDTSDDVAVDAASIGATGDQAAFSLTGVDLPDSVHRLRLVGSAVGGIRDLHGNPLNGLFTGTFPSGADNLPGDFVATFTLTHEYAKCDLDRDEDVDQSDFGMFQACITGLGMPPTEPSCQAADFDDDLDVDDRDLMVFLRCFSGPGQPADLSCGR